MGRIVANLFTIARATGAHVMAVHHPGYSRPNSRGHSSLPAALDTELLMGIDPENEKVNFCRPTKQRNLPLGGGFRFRLEPVTLGFTVEKKRPVTACTVIHIDDKVTADKASGKPPTIAEGMYRELCNLCCDETVRMAIPMRDGVPMGTYGVKEGVWRDAVLSKGIISKDGKNPHAQFSTMVSRMVRSEIVRKQQDSVWPLTKQNHG
jgi:hypothetical protein